MSVKAVEWAFRQELPHVRKFVLVALAEFADAGGGCFPSQATVAKRCGIARQTVNAAVADLKRDGLIECSIRRRSNGSDTSCSYKLMMNSTADPVTEDDTPCHRGRHPLSPTVTPPVLEDDTHNRKDNRKGNLKRNITKKRPPDKFDDFWTQYPKKVGKGAARKSYTKALKTASHEDIMAGVARYMPDPQFTCNPSTWLNQERWTDEYTQPHRQEGKRTSADRLRSALAGAAKAFDR